MINILIPTTPERKDRLEKTLASIKRSNCNQELNIVIDINEYEGYVKSVLRMLDKVDGLVMVVTDDVEVCSSSIQALYNAYTENFPNNDGLCVYGDGHWNLEEFGLPFAHSNTLKGIINPDYFHNFHDREMCEVMRRRGRYLAVPKAQVIHNHYQWGKSVKDKTYTLGEETSDADGKLFHERLKNDFK